MSNRIFLIGPMGAGKSTSGRQLAKQLHYEFLDSDKVIEERTGVGIPLIFEMEGEVGFRKREQKIIEELTQLDHTLLATGGGAVLNEDNRIFLQQRGFVVYLFASVEQQLARTAHDTHRPLLKTPNPAAKLKELFEIRHPIYTSISHLTVNTDGHKVNWVVKEILKNLGLDALDA